MNLEYVLRQVGAEDGEIEHLSACDVCSIWNGYDGAELERCPANPLSIEAAEHRALLAIGRGLMAALEVPKPPPGAFERAMESIIEFYKERLIEDLSRPIFSEVMRGMTRSGA